MRQTNNPPRRPGHYQTDFIYSRRSSVINNYNRIYLDSLLKSVALEIRENGYSLQSFAAIDNAFCEQ